MLRRLTLAIVAIGLLSMNATVTFASGRSGSMALTGRDAAAYRVPNDVVRLWSARLPMGLRQVRFQQVVDGAQVLGGQLTFLRDANGVNKAVIGAHYPGLTPTNARNITAKRAQGIAAARIGNAGRWVGGPEGLLLATTGPSTLMYCPGAPVGAWMSNTGRAGLDGEILVLVDNQGKELGRLRPGT